jgi:hypothetical protein
LLLLLLLLLRVPFETIQTFRLLQFDGQSLSMSSPKSAFEPPSEQCLHSSSSPTSPDGDLWFRDALFSANWFVRLFQGPATELSEPLSLSLDFTEIAHFSPAIGAEVDSEWRTALVVLQQSPEIAFCEKAMGIPNSDGEFLERIHSRLSARGVRSRFPTAGTLQGLEEYL